MPQSILIIGAGIIGTALAFRLAEAGCQLTVIDPNPVGGLASEISFGWINATYENPKPYYDLRMAAMADWEALNAEFPDLPYGRNGTLYFDFYGVDLSRFTLTIPRGAIP